MKSIYEEALLRQINKSIETTAKLVQDKIEIKESHGDLLDTLELLLKDIEWSEGSPTLKLVKRMIKKAKKL